MIERYFVSKIYTKDELHRDLWRFFRGNEQDIDLFIEALVGTGQIIKRGNSYILPVTHEKILKRPIYEDFTAELGIVGKAPRLGIRGSKRWTDRYGYPTSMRLIRVNGVYVKERPFLKITRGRYPATVEVWRAEIPAFYRRHYDVKHGATVRVHIGEITPEYFTLLRLWGYRYRVMLSFGETKEKANIRYLELDGTGFVNEVSRSISKDIQIQGDKIKSIILDLLHEGNIEYYGLYEETAIAGNLTEPPIEIIPMKESGMLKALVQLRDLEKYRVILEWITDIEYMEIPPISAFIETSYISTGLKQARGITKLTGKWK